MHLLCPHCRLCFPPPSRSSLQGSGRLQKLHKPKPLHTRILPSSILFHECRLSCVLARFAAPTLAPDHSFKVFISPHVRPLTRPLFSLSDGLFAAAGVKMASTTPKARQSMLAEVAKATKQHVNLDSGSSERLVAAAENRLAERPTTRACLLLAARTRRMLTVRAAAAGSEVRWWDGW